MRLGSGHPSPVVRSAARELEPLPFTASVQAQRQAKDVLLRRSTTDHRKFAQEVHGKAMATLAGLESAVTDAGQGKQSPRQP
jgi:hypothetical protein